MSSERPGIVKLVIRVGSNGDYLMVRKRAPGTERDGRLEFLGGHVEGRDATAWAAMLREASEEEGSGRVASALDRAGALEARRVWVPTGAREQLHYLAQRRNRG